MPTRWSACSPLHAPRTPTPAVGNKLRHRAVPARKRRITMRAIIAAGGALLSLSALAQQPPYATTKVDGTDNVYVFRAGNHQAMFVVTSAGVIATDPIGYGRPEMVKTYIEEIRKVTDKPVKYLVYSHHHNDHISGG